jgi:hypothetical protein
MRIIVVSHFQLAQRRIHAAECSDDLMLVFHRQLGGFRAISTDGEAKYLNFGWERDEAAADPPQNLLDKSGSSE